MKKRPIYFISLKDMLDGKLTVKKLDEYIIEQAKKKKMPEFMRSAVTLMNFINHIEKGGDYARR